MGEAGWALWRQDDNGSRFLVARFATDAESAPGEARFEAPGHEHTDGTGPGPPDPPGSGSG